MLVQGKGGQWAFQRASERQGQDPPCAYLAAQICTPI